MIMTDGLTICPNCRDRDMPVTQKVCNFCKVDLSPDGDGRNWEAVWEEQQNRINSLMGIRSELYERLRAKSAELHKVTEEYNELLKQCDHIDNVLVRHPK